MVGQAIGALASGVTLDVTAQATAVVFATLTALSLLLAAAVWLIPETSLRQEGFLPSLLPQIAVPTAIRRLLAQSTPALIACWATGGLYLSLGANIMRSQFHATSHVAESLTITSLTIAGAVSMVVARRMPPRVITIYGTTALAGGTILTLLALASHDATFYLAAVGLAGSGFGAAFLGVMRSLGPLVPPSQRAETFAVIFIISYLAFGVPAVAAGALIPVYGLLATTTGYGAVVTFLATSATALRWRSSQ